MNLMKSRTLRYDRRDDRLLERPRRGHDIAGLDAAVGRFHVETRSAVVLPHGFHFNAGTDRCVYLLRVGGEVVRDLIFRGEGIGADVEFLTRESVMPCWAVRTRESHRPVRHRSAMR